MLGAMPVSQLLDFLSLRDRPANNVPPARHEHIVAEEARLLAERVRLQAEEARLLAEIARLKRLNSDLSFTLAETERIKESYPSGDQLYASVEEPAVLSPSQHCSGGGGGS